MPLTHPKLDRPAVLEAARTAGYPTVSGLADKAGVHRISLYRALSPTNPTTPSVRMLDGLARALGGIDMGSLMRDSELAS